MEDFTCEMVFKTIAKYKPVFYMCSPAEFNKVEVIIFYKPVENIAM